MITPKQAAAIWYVHCFQLIRTEGFYDRGVYQRINTEVSSHKGNVQPAQQADIDRLPEGSRTDGAVTLFTDLALRTSESPNAIADRIMYQGVEYEVSGVERWPSHSRYTLTKVGQ